MHRERGEKEDRMKRAWLAGLLLLLVLGAGAGWSAPGEAPPVLANPKAPVPLTRAALLKRLSADEEVRKALADQIAAVGGKPGGVLAGKEPAKPGEDVNDLWHQGATLTPRDPQLAKGDRPLGILVVYNVFMHSLKDCLEGNYLPIATGPGTSKYAAAGLYDLPGAPDAEHPWIVEVGFEVTGLKDQVKLQVNHEPIPFAKLGDTALIGLVVMGGGRHFVEITQPPADPAYKTRNFYYTRILRL
jgi:hypothetical protein